MFMTHMSLEDGDQHPTLRPECVVDFPSATSRGVVVRPDWLRGGNPARLIAPTANPRLLELELPLSTPNRSCRASDECPLMGSNDSRPHDWHGSNAKGSLRVNFRHDPSSDGPDERPSRY